MSLFNNAKISAKITVKSLTLMTNCPPPVPVCLTFHCAYLFLENDQTDQHNNLNMNERGRCIRAYYLREQ